MTAFERYKLLWERVTSPKPGDPYSPTNLADEEIDMSALPLLASKFTQDDWDAFAPWWQELQRRSQQEFREATVGMEMALRLLAWEEEAEWAPVPEDLLAYYTERATNSVDPMIRLTAERILGNIRERGTP